FQSGLRIKHLISKNWLTDLVISGITTSESEDTNIEGGYRLCDIDKDPSSTTYNDCLVTRGIGTNFKYARNALNANILDIRLNNVHLNNAGNMEWEWGVQINSADFDDELNEYSFVDSADYITNFESAVANNILVNTSFAGYSQTKYYFKSGSTLEGGIRFIRPRLTGEVLVAPRLYFKLPTEINGVNVTFHSGAGVHYQPSFYREYRESSGNLNYLNSSTQSSFHLVGGLDMNLKIWDRPFNFVSEVYYKYLWNIIPYDIDNIKIRYLPSYSGTAYATGLDSRFGGEFIQGTESWFSLSILSTKEKLDNTNNTFIRRPSDQRVTFGLYFQDHFPENPNMKVSINLQFGTGLPFGPPGNIIYRSYFTGEMYKRIDLGFTRDIIKEKYKAFLSLEILNLLGSDNTITYSWVEDVSGRQIAIPNALSARFFNFKIGFTI
ncbi:MAG: TonB-dependent receptor, partial [Cyclobacteriaceae bacterium]|nr:TonB-dependent receptor [Cyclobacteriaceae bacterium]